MVSLQPVLGKEKENMKIILFGAYLRWLAAPYLHFSGEMWLALWPIWGTNLLNGEMWLALRPVWGTNLLNGDLLQSKPNKQ